MSTYIITYPKGFDEPGGGTKSFLQISQFLQKSGVNVITVPVSELADGGTPDPSLTVIPAHPNRFHYLLNGMSVAQVIKEIQAQTSVDAVICWEHEAAFLVNLLRANQITFGMIAAHPSYQLRVDAEKSSLLPIKALSNYWFRWRALKAADVVFVSSDFTRNELVRLFQLSQDRIILTHRGLDPSFARIERSFSGTIENFIFYGSLAPIKGVFDVIESLGLLAQQGQLNWRLKVAGWGDQASFHEAISKAGITDHVTYLGSLKQRRLIEELAWADVAVLPSRAESFGRSIAEAQAAGLPVVSYKAGSVPEIVDHEKTGWLVPPGDTGALANALQNAIAHPQQTFAKGLAGRERVTQVFSWDKTAQAIHAGIQAAKQKLA